MKRTDQHLAITYYSSTYLALGLGFILYWPVGWSFFSLDPLILKQLWQSLQLIMNSKVSMTTAHTRKMAVEFRTCTTISDCNKVILVANLMKQILALTRTHVLLQILAHISTLRSPPPPSATDITWPTAQLSCARKWPLNKMSPFHFEFERTAFARV